MRIDRVKFITELARQDMTQKRLSELSGVSRATHDSISVFPCDEDDIMSFRVPDKLFKDHRCVMRINSKRFIHGIMKVNGLDITRTYTLKGEYLKAMNIAVFSLTDGVTLCALKEAK